MYPSPLAQINDTTYITITQSVNLISNTSYDSKLVTINQWGQVQDTLIDYASTRSSFQIFSLSGSNFLTVSWLYNGGNPKLLFVKFDNELNTIWSKAYYAPIGFISTNKNFCEEDSEGNLYVLNGYNNSESFAVKLDLNGDLSLTKILPYQTTCFTSVNDTSFFSHSWINGQFITSELDDSFELRESNVSFDNVETSSISEMKTKGDSLVIKTYSDIDNNFKLYYLNKNSRAITDSATCSHDPYYLSSVPFESLIMSQEKNFYIMGRVPAQFNSGLYVSKFDESFSELWRLYTETEGGYYDIFSLIPTNDDGLLLNFRTKWGSSYLDMGTRILKIGPNGEIPLQIEDSPVKLVEHLAYPNPGTEQLNISVSKNMEQASLSIYNLSGQLILQEQFSGFDVRINTSRLTQGAYIYKIHNQKEMLYSGQWIKE